MSKKGLKIAMFLGSIRDGRNGKRVAMFMKSELEKRNMEVDLIDAAEVSLPILKQPLQFYRDKSEAPEILHELNSRVLAADAYVFVSCEYNSSISPGLANMIDHIPPASFKFRPSGIVNYSFGPYGGIRAGMHLTNILMEIGSIPVPVTFNIPKVTENIDESGNPSTDRMTTGAERLLSQLEWYATAIKNHRALDDPLQK